MFSRWRETYAFIEDDNRLLPAKLLPADHYILRGEESPHNSSPTMNPTDTWAIFSGPTPRLAVKKRAKPGTTISNPGFGQRVRGCVLVLLAHLWPH